MKKFQVRALSDSRIHVVVEEMCCWQVTLRERPGGAHIFNR